MRVDTGFPYTWLYTDGICQTLEPNPCNTDGLQADEFELEEEIREFKTDFYHGSSELQFLSDASVTGHFGRTNLGLGENELTNTSLLVVDTEVDYINKNIIPGFLGLAPVIDEN